MGLLNSSLDNKIRDKLIKSNPKFYPDDTIECQWIEKDWLEVHGIQSGSWTVIIVEGLQDFLTSEELEEAKRKYGKSYKE